MLDGLRKDFPQLFDLARRVPNPRVSRAPLPWSVLAVCGAGFFVSTVLTVIAPPVDPHALL